MFYFVVFALMGILRSVNLANVEGATTAPNTLHSPNNITINDADYWDDDDFVPYKNDRHDTFDWKLLRAVLLSDSSNVIVSPFSVKIVLALLLEGAGAESATKHELSSIMPNIRTPTLARELYKKILSSLNERSKNYVLNVGSKIFVDSFIEPRQRFSSIAESHYGAPIERLEFKNAQFSTDIINNWCNNITNGHIPKLLTKDEVQSSVMLMINAIYFEGVWRKVFNEDNSFEFVFYTQPQQEVRTKFMTQEARFYYFESTKLNAKIIRLPYKGKKFSMTIILPGAKGGLDELIREVEGDGFKRLQWFMEEKEVKVTIPKFKFDYTSHLKNTLQTLGIREIFGASASLPGLSRGIGTRNALKVSDVIQKSGLIVNEKGTSAYAATDVQLTNKFGGPILEFNANRPFMFIIEDETTSTILFAGKVMDPTK